MIYNSWRRVRGCHVQPGPWFEPGSRFYLIQSRKRVEWLLCRWSCVPATGPERSQCSRFDTCIMIYNPKSVGGEYVAVMYGSVHGSNLVQDFILYILGKKSSSCYVGGAVSQRPARRGHYRHAQALRVHRRHGRGRGK